MLSQRGVVDPSLLTPLNPTSLMLPNLNNNEQSKNSVTQTN